MHCQIFAKRCILYNVKTKHIVCYTCVTGGYDSIRQPSVVNKDIDYICFTDDLSINGGIWQLKPIPKDLEFLSNVKKQRIIKICPHRYLKEYDISVWVDGNIKIKRSLIDFINQYDLEKCPLYVRVHPSRKCIYEEAEACIELGKDSKLNIDKQIKAYKVEGYPKNIGMVESCILLRKHNDPKCQMLCNLWASELLKYSHRDQLSFNYACWKMHFIPGILKNEFKTQNDTFEVANHG